jgi:hypothetical protein
MKHYEVHVIETELDSIAACTSGLLVEPFFVSACADCGDDVGSTDSTFVPFAVVLDDEDEWYLCTYCAEPVTDPESTSDELDFPLTDDIDLEDLDPYNDDGFYLV